MLTLSFKRNCSLMKKWLSLIALLLLLFTAFYMFIPSLVPSAYSRAANCTRTAAERQMIHQERWQWWPGSQTAENSYVFNNCRYDIHKILLNGIRLTVSDGKDSLNGFIQFQDYGKDSTLFTWTPFVELSTQPLQRMAEYFAINRLNRNATQVVDSIQRYFNQMENVYGMKIIQENITDSSLISLKNTYDHYPTTAEIYAMIDSLKNYIRQENGEQNNYPMLNVRKTGENRYEAMTAVPTKWDLPATGRFELKKMVLGIILMGEVRGGPSRVRRAEREIDFYAKDYAKMAPAIPFQSLVTDRMNEPDTSKWITRVYYPIF